MLVMLLTDQPNETKTTSAEVIICMASLIMIAPESRRREVDFGSPSQVTQVKSFQFQVAAEFFPHRPKSPRNLRIKVTTLVQYLGL